MKLQVLMFYQDDPKKCTAAKMVKFGLAKKIKNVLTKEELDSIDVVIPIPATSRTSALPISIELGKDLKEGFDLARKVIVEGKTKKYLGELIN